MEGMQHTCKQVPTGLGDVWMRVVLMPRSDGRKAAELKRDVKEYCDDMANQFKEVWRELDISFDDFIQTSEPRHHAGCQHFIQKVYDNGHIYKGHYEGLYCEGCEGFKTEKEVK